MNRTITLFIFLLLLMVSSGFAQTNNASATRDVDNIRNRVKQFEASKKRVVVFTRYDEKFKGQISSSDDEQFTLELTGQGQSKTFRYNTIYKVQKSGGISVASIVAIAAVAGGAAILIGTLLIPCRNEGGC